MATAVIRTTYSLDADTIARLDRLARSWNLSRSAALRKLIRESRPVHQPESDARLAALRRLQELGRQRKPEEFEAWARCMRAQRDAWTDRILARGKRRR